MSVSLNIQFLSNSNSYELIVPDSIANALGLKDTSGNPYSIQSQNKMQLEWLAQSILSNFNKLNDTRMINKKKLARKRLICFGLLALCAIIALLKEPISKIINTNTLYINLVVFGVAIISCLQLLKYLALGLSGINKGDFSADPEIEQIKELILKDYAT